GRRARTLPAVPGTQRHRRDAPIPDQRLLPSQHERPAARDRRPGHAGHRRIPVVPVPRRAGRPGAHVQPAGEMGGPRRRHGGRRPRVRDRLRQVPRRGGRGHGGGAAGVGDALVQHRCGDGARSHRRGFLGRIAAGAAALGLGGWVAPLDAAPRPRSARDVSANPEFEAWLNKITGKHKMIYDVPEPNDGFAFAWARVFLNTTNETYGTTDGDNSVVIVLRHSGIPYAMESAMWAKYKLGEGFKIADPATKGPAVRHPLLRLKPGDAPIPGMGADELLAKGVLIGVCNIALTIYSAKFASQM